LKISRDGDDFIFLHLFWVRLFFHLSHYYFLYYFWLFGYSLPHRGTVVAGQVDRFLGAVGTDLPGGSVGIAIG
jgi:hypothetical protein